MAKKNFYVYNVFGINPYTNAKAAGRDFYIPKLESYNEISEEKLNVFLDAMCGSTGLSRLNVETILDRIAVNLAALHGTEDQALNVLLLFLSFDTVEYSYKLIDFDEDKSGYALDSCVRYFFDNVLIFDKNMTPGLRMHFGEYLFINSGIKLKLPKDTAGVFRNKSGRGKNGWDVRAEVVDEDYSGYVHLSVAYTAVHQDADKRIFCGDKLTQMLLLPIVQAEDVVVTEEEFNNLHKKSERADKCFGSSNEKH